MVWREETYRFDVFTVDPSAYTLRRAGESVPLSPRPFDLLLYLLRRSARLVTKDELLNALWPDVVVTENTLTQAMSDLRRALQDKPASPRFIETVPRRGYRFIASIEIDEPAAEPALPRPAGRAIAVMDFSNLTGDEADAWLAPGIAETVTNDLRALAGLQVVERWQVVEAAGGPDRSPAKVAADLEGRLGRGGQLSAGG